MFKQQELWYYGRRRTRLPKRWLIQEGLTTHTRYGRSILSRTTGKNDALSAARSQIAERAALCSFRHQCDEERSMRFTGRP